MKVIITGANGQDGSILTKLCQDRGIATIGINSSQNGHIFTLDSYTRNQELFANLLIKEEPTHIVHLASKHGPRGSMTKNWTTDRKIFEVGSWALSKIITAINQVNPAIRLITASSSRVYKPSKPFEMVDENSLMSPVDFYGTVKADMRNQIISARDAGLHASTAILFNHYSVNSKPGYLGEILAREIANAISRNQPYVNLASPDACADFSHAYDICTGIFSMLSLSAPTDLLLGSGKATSMKALISEISKK